MSFAGKLAIGIATGLSGYYGKVAEQEMEEKKSAVLEQRARALAQFQSGLRREEAREAGGITRENYTHKAETDLAENVALLPHKTKAEIEVATAREAAGLKRDTIKAGIEHANRVSIERLTSSLDMDEARQKAALDLQNELVAAGKKAARWEVTNDGAMVAFNSRGEVIGQTSKHVFVPPGFSGDSSNETPADQGRRLVGEARRRKGTLTTNQPAAPASTSGQLEQALADLGQFYPNATPERFPALFRNGKKIPIAEAEKIVRARFGG